MVVVLERLEIAVITVLHGAHVLAHEGRGVLVDAEAVGVVLRDVVLDRAEQMGLAESALAVDEQRVVRLLVHALRHLQRGLVCEDVLVALDEPVEGEARVVVGDGLDERVLDLLRRLGIVPDILVVLGLGCHLAHGGLVARGHELDFERDILESRLREAVLDGCAVLEHGLLHEAHAGREPQGAVVEGDGLAAPEHCGERLADLLLLEQVERVGPEGLRIGFDGIVHIRSIRGTSNSGKNVLYRVFNRGYLHFPCVAER